MLDICMPAVSGAIVASLEGRKASPRLANRHPSACPCNTYPAADGEILIYCLTEAHWRQFARLIGRPDLADDPRYRDHQKRYSIIDEVDQLVAQWTKGRGRDEMVEILIAKDIPCAPVRTIDEVANDPDLERRKLIRTANYPDRGEVKVLGSAIKLSGTTGDETSARPPALGEHTAEVLGRIGISSRELEELRKQGAV
jgi:crotonobetainyl-CoA:carnitine CoA-transferase CaiB-like acyl-CoA transferase